MKWYKRGGLSCISIGVIAALMALGSINVANATQYGPGSGSFSANGIDGSWSVQQFQSTADARGYSRSAHVKVQQDRQLGGYNIMENQATKGTPVHASVMGGGATITDFAWIW